jgi:5-methylcytosine-specific restriction endonuclease McrA
MTKRCSGCKETKGHAEFGRNKRTLDGFACYCKACVSEKNRAHYEANRAERVAYQAEYRASNAEKVQQADRDRYESRKPWRAEYSERNRDRLREQGRKFREEHPGYHGEWRRRNPDRLEYERAHREANREQYRIKARRQHENNPQLRRQIKNKYRARKIDNGHIPYTPTQLDSKVAYWGNRCWMCAKSLHGHVIQMDHVKPLHKGGMDCLSNLRPACGRCNASKGHRWPYIRELTA